MMILDKMAVDIACPRCHFLNRVTIKQARIGDVTICRGCKANIHLQDHLNTVRQGVRSVERTMREFQEQLQGLGTITIRL